MSGSEIYLELSAQCHGPDGEGGIGPALRDPAFQASVTDKYLFETINKGHAATAIIGWGEILSAEQIQQLVEFIRQMQPVQQPPAPTPTTSTSTSTSAVTPTPTTSAAVSFSNDVVPILEAKCNVCHGSLGGWNGSSYENVMTSGDHAPTVIAGDPEASLLAQKLLGTQTTGAIMPPAGKLSDDEIQTILDWIESGASDN